MRRKLTDIPSYEEKLNHEQCDQMFKNKVAQFFQTLAQKWEQQLWKLTNLPSYEEKLNHEQCDQMFENKVAQFSQTLAQKWEQQFLLKSNVFSK